MINVNKIDVLANLSTDMKKVLAKQEELSKDVFVTEGKTFDDLRRDYISNRKFWNKGGPTVEKTEDHIINTRHGDIKVRFYYPNTSLNNPCIVYIHGGGFVVGNLDTHNRIMRTIATYSEAVVIGVDYTLSPEAKFPRAIEEIADTIEYIRKHSKEFGINKDIMGIAGDSGGANLSLVVSNYLRDEYNDNSFIKTLLLYYGSFGLTDSASIRSLGGPWDGLSIADLNYYLTLYVNDISQREHKYINCYNADLKKSMPACYLACGDMDPLLDDNRLLYEVLTRNGVTAKYTELKGLLHSFIHYAEMLDDAVKVLKESCEFFKQNNNVRY